MKYTHVSIYILVRLLMLVLVYFVDKQQLSDSQVRVVIEMKGPHWWDALQVHSNY